MYSVIHIMIYTINTYSLVHLISYSNQASRRSKLSLFGHCKAPSMINEHSLSPVVEVVLVSGEGNPVTGGFILGDGDVL